MWGKEEKEKRDYITISKEITISVPSMVGRAVPEGSSGEKDVSECSCAMTRADLP